MDVAHHEAMQPIAALTTVADSLPGLGIVAAVLGVVITMGALGGPPEEIGKKVAAALVGTFLGILMLRRHRADRILHDQAGRRAQRLSPHPARPAARVRSICRPIAVEMRRAIAAHVRPSFDQMEQACKGAVRRAQRRRRAVAPSEAMPTPVPSSSSRRRPRTTATTAARGRSPTPTSSPR